MMSMPVPGRDGGDAAAAPRAGVPKGRRGLDINSGAETPAPHVNWLLAPHFCGRDRSRSRASMPSGRPRLFRHTNIDTYVTGLDTVSVNNGKDDMRWSTLALRRGNKSR